MEHPGRVVVRAAAAPGAQNGALVGQDLGLHEEIAEGRMQFVSDGRRDDDFGIAGEFQRAPFAAPVGQAAAAQFDIVFRRHHDFRVGVDLVIAAAEFRPAFRENHLVAVGTLERRLECGGPALAGIHVAHVAERAPVVAGAVFAPAGDGQVLPAAGARAAVGDHDVIAPIGQQLHFGNGGVGRVQHAHGHFGLARRGAADDG
ncbi:hypothetical protein D3C71_1219670 [compost metagenome]